MKNFNLEDHVNYVHLVGEVVRLEYRDRPSESSYCIVLLEVATEFKGKRHDPIKLKLIFWDSLAQALNEANLKSRNSTPGDIINVEGRLTVRSKDGQLEYTVTGNKVKVLRRIDGKEPFLQEIEKRETR